MGKNWITTTQGSTQSSQLYVFPDFKVGTWPTLLDATQAQKVKSFIEGIALRSQFKIVTGNVARPGFEILWGATGPTWQIEIPTALRMDLDPYLGAHLKLDGFNVIANRSGTVFKMSPEGLQISEKGGGSGQVVLLEGGSGSGGVGQGFKAASGGESMVWTMMKEDGSPSQFIETNGAGGLKFASALKVIDLVAQGSGVVAGSSTIDLDTEDEGTDTLTLLIADGLRAVGNDGDDSITLSINSEPMTFVSLIATGGGTVSGDTTVEIYENALTLDAGDNITLTGTNVTGEVRITADDPSGWATLIYLTAREGGIVSGSPVGLHDGHWDFFAGDGIELHKQTVPYLGVEIKTQDVDLVGDSGSGAYIIGDDDALTFVGAGGTTTSVAGNVVTITGGGSGSYTWEAQDEHGNTQEIFDGTELTIFGSDFIHVELTPSATVPYFYVQLSATGTPSATTFLRGDNVWATVAGTAEVLNVDGDTGSVAITLATEDLHIEGGNGIETTADGGETLTVAVDDTVGQMINGIPFGNYSANNLYLLEGDNVTLDTDTPAGTITINADKYAIVSSPEPDTYVALACVEMPETRFDDILTIEVDGKGSIEYALDPTYVHVCDPGTIKPISYTCTEAAIAGLEVKDGILHISFSHVTPLPREITVKVSGIRAGRSGKRFVEFTEEEARNNAAFWNGWTG